MTVSNIPEPFIYYFEFVQVIQLLHPLAFWWISQGRLILLQAFDGNFIGLFTLHTCHSPAHLTQHAQLDARDHIDIIAAGNSAGSRAGVLTAADRHDGVCGCLPKDLIGAGARIQEDILPNWEASIA